MLAERGELDQLRDRADAGDGNAAWRLAGLLARHGDLDQLRVRADAGDRYAALELADLLTDRGDLDGSEQVLRTLADTGYRYIIDRLVNVLSEQGRAEEADLLRRFGLNPDGSIVRRDQAELAGLPATHVLGSADPRL